MTYEYDIDWEIRQAEIAEKVALAAKRLAHEKDKPTPNTEYIKKLEDELCVLHKLKFNKELEI